MHLGNSSPERVLACTTRIIDDELDQATANEFIRLTAEDVCGVFRHVEDEPTHVTGNVDPDIVPCDAIAHIDARPAHLGDLTLPDAQADSFVAANAVGVQLAKHLYRPE